MTHIHVYKAKDGYRWRFISGNGRIIADSSEAYTRAYDAKKAAYKMIEFCKMDTVTITVEKTKSKK